MFGRFVRLPLSFLPPELVVPVLRGPLRGSKWILGSSLNSCWLGSYEYEKQMQIASALKPSSVFYDIGANVGFYSLLAARLVTSGKTYAFEPLPSNVRYLRRHLKLNVVQDVEVLELAISDQVGTAFFEEAPCRLMGRLAQQGTLGVRTATLDSLVLQGKIAPPSVVKMDIEGAELPALHGASECIQQYRPVIFLATHGREVHQACCALLKSWGYGCQLIDSLTTEDRGEVVARIHG
jgi:FkbM family methyltransferase